MSPDSATSPQSTGERATSAAWRSALRAFDDDLCRRSDENARDDDERADENRRPAAFQDIQCRLDFRSNLKRINVLS